MILIITAEVITIIVMINAITPTSIASRKREEKRIRKKSGIFFKFFTMI